VACTRGRCDDALHRLRDDARRNPRFAVRPRCWRCYHAAVPADEAAVTERVNRQRESSNGPEPTPHGSVADALSSSRVDLIALIREGIPAPEYVLGGEGWLRKGKRYLFFAPAGNVKTLGDARRRRGSR
jgi:hypothetical protein